MVKVRTSGAVVYLARAIVSAIVINRMGADGRYRLPQLTSPGALASPDTAGEESSNVVDCRVLIDHAATLMAASSGRSISAPFSNLAPARTSATRCAPLR